MNRYILSLILLSINFLLAGCSGDSLSSDEYKYNLSLTGPAVTGAPDIQLQGVCGGLFHEPITLSGNFSTSPLTVNCEPTNTYIVDVTVNDVTTDFIATQGTKTVNFSVTYDTVSPVVAITSPASGALVNVVANINGTCEAGLVIQISGDVTPRTANCNPLGAFSASVTFSPTPTVGSRTVTLTQTDAVGNTGSISRTYSFDSEPPVITITSPTNGSSIGVAGTVEGTCESGLDVTISGDIVDVVVADCDNETFTAAVSFNAFPIEGNRNISATQTDLAGNFASDMKTYVFDSVPPLLEVTSPLFGDLVGITTTVTGSCESGLMVYFTGDVTPASVMCIDESFSFLVTFTSALDENKLLDVTQTDLANNSTVINLAFQFDGLVPDVKIISPSNGSYVGVDVEVTGTCEDGYGIEIDGDITPSYADCIGGEFITNVSFNPTPTSGTRTLSARQIDLAGNIGMDTKTYNFDSLAPVVTILSPVSGATVGENITLSGECETGLDVKIYGDIQTPVTTSCIGGSYSSAIQLNNDFEGYKTVQVSQEDLAGNFTEVQEGYYLDSNPPSLSIVSPISGSSVGTSATIQGICEEGLNITISGDIEDPRVVPCLAGAYSFQVTFLDNGNPDRSLQLVQVDQVGNITTVDSNFVYDNLDPIVVITSPIEGDYVSLIATIEGTCESDLAVTLSGDLVQSVITDCISGNFSVAVDFNAEPLIGERSLTASQSDLAGNTGSDTKVFVFDSEPPVVSIILPTPGTEVSGSVIFSGVCETGFDVAITGDILTPPVISECLDGEFEAVVDVLPGLTGDPRLFTASQEDLAGNIGQDTQEYIFGP